MKQPVAKRVEPEDPREQILRAAEELFAEKGFEGARISELAERAGVTKSLIHHYVGNKEDLWAAVSGRLFEEYADAQRALIVSRDADIDVFRNSMIAYFRFLQRNPRFVRLACWMNIERGQCFDSLGEGLTEFGVMRLLDAQKRGDLRPDIHPFFVLTMFFSLVEHWFQARPELVSRYPHGLSDSELDENYLDAVLKVMLDGVRNPALGQPPAV